MRKFPNLFLIKSAFVSKLCTLIAHRVHRHRTRVVVVSRVVCIYMSARPTPQVVVVKVAKKNEQKKKKSSSCAAFVKSRPHVKAQFPRDILNACERFQSEFELRATLDYDAKSRRRPEDDSDDLSSTLTKKLRLREVFPEEDVSDASIAFLERDIEAVVRDFCDHAFVGVKEMMMMMMMMMAAVGRRRRRRRPRRLSCRCRCCDARCARNCTWTTSGCER